MLRDLDIADDDGGLPTVTADSSNNPQSENESLASANSSSQQSGQKPPTRVQKPDVEKTLMASKFNHRIYRTYIRGKTEQAKKLIEVSFSNSVFTLIFPGTFEPKRGTFVRVCSVNSVVNRS
jgi:hypothetical protein